MSFFDEPQITDKLPKIYLSERNLRTLLSKLERDRAGDNTACSIIKQQTPSAAYRQTMKSVMISAVQDEDYYGAQNRSAGEMHPLEEDALANIFDYKKLLLKYIEHVSNCEGTSFLGKSFDSGIDGLDTSECNELRRLDKILHDDLG